MTCRVGQKRWSFRFQVINGGESSSFIGEKSGAECGEQGRAKKGSLRIGEGSVLAPREVSLDLEPGRIASAAAGGNNFTNWKAGSGFAGA